MAFFRIFSVKAHGGPTDCKEQRMNGDFVRPREGRGVGSS